MPSEPAATSPLVEAIVQALTDFADQREESLLGDETERLGELAHELRNTLATASMAFEVLRGGRVGMTGSTSALLGRSLAQLSALVDASLARVRAEKGIRMQERVSVRDFFREIEVGAHLEASGRGLTLAVADVSRDVTIEVDRLLLSSAVSNLLQNAFKFTRPSGHVSLDSRATESRVLIEVQDECGGLPPGKAEDLFRPFAQGGADRTGLGLGLSISRKSVEANDGQLSVRDMPGHGCIFTIDLPRFSRSP